MADSIDVHWHVIPRVFVDAVRRGDAGDVAYLEAGADGTERLMFRPPPGVPVEQGHAVRPASFDPDLIVAGLDRMRLEAAAMSVAPTLFFDWAAPADSVRLTRLLNDAIAELVRSRPGRLFGLAVLPMQDGQAAAIELERAVSVLGMRGAAICSHINGMDLDHPSLEPVFAAAERLHAPLFIHPQNQGDTSRIRDYHLWNSVGFPTESAIAAARLIYGGVLERFPGLRVVLSHGGGSFPYQLGRLDFSYTSRRELFPNTPRKPSDYLESIYCDSLTHSQLSLRFLIDRVGEGHVVLGSDYPFDMGDPAPVDSVRRLQLQHRAESRILGGNLTKLLSLA